MGWGVFLLVMCLCVIGAIELFIRTIVPVVITIVGIVVGVYVVMAFFKWLGNNQY